MTDHPADTPRLTDAQLDDMEGGGWGLDPSEVYAKAAAEIRESRALIAALKADGCPHYDKDPSDPWSPRLVCAYCDGPAVDVPGAEPRFDHRPMEDGSLCLWERIERA